MVEKIDKYESTWQHVRQYVFLIVGVLGIRNCMGYSSEGDD